MINRIRNRLISCLFGKDSRIAYSQEGEDLLLERIFADRPIGFYIDVGAHHPVRFSNTFRLYQRGWHGIVIDPLPGTRRLFKNKRPRDICVEVGVSNTPGDLLYYQFNDPALNTFSESLANERCRSTPYKIIGKSVIPTRRLDDILSTHNPSNTKIDLLSIDAEGFDLSVLQSNDWKRWAPQFVLTEILQQSLLAVVERREPVAQFMHEHGYIPLAKLYNTVVYKKS